MKNLTKRFESLTAFSAWLNNNPLSGYFKKAKKESSRTGSADFTQTESYEESDKLLLNGWSDGARRVSAVMASGVTGSAPVRRVVNSVVGFTPNVPAAIAGRPKNMRRAIKREEPRRVVSICYNCCVAGSVDASEIEKAAAKLFNVVAGLERSGVRVELWVVMINIENNQNASAAVKIKSAEQPFNLLKMVYPCVHPSFFRRHLFALVERVGVTGREWHCYGHVIRDAQKIADSLKLLRVPSQNVFDYYLMRDKTENEIIKLIK